MSAPSTVDQPFCIAPVAGKGRGIIATRNIEPGETILVEKPLFQAGLRSEQTVAHLVKGLPPAHQQFFQSLSVGGRVGNPHLSRFDNNAISLGSDSTLAGLFYLGTHFDHSCRPNVSRVWDEVQLVERFTASVPIKEGEELCIYYVDVFKSKAERQADLKAKFGFDCTCEACSLEGEALRVSDVRRTTFKILEQMIPSLTDNPLRLVSLAKQALACLDQEGVLVGCSSITYDAFQACVAFSDGENAKKWIKRGLEYKKLEVGEGGSDYQRFERLLKACGVGLEGQEGAYGAVGRRREAGKKRLLSLFFLLLLQAHVCEQTLSIRTSGRIGWEERTSIKAAREGPRLQGGRCYGMRWAEVCCRGSREEECTSTGTRERR